MLRVSALLTCAFVMTHPVWTATAGPISASVRPIPVRSEFSRVITVTQPGSVTVSLRNPQGSVAIKRWKQRAIVVRAVKRFAGPPARQTWLLDAAVDVKEAAPNQVDIQARWSVGDKAPAIGDGALDYVLAVPEDTCVLVEQEKGPVLAHGLNGRLRIRLREGDIRVSDLTGWAQLTTERGAITVEGVSGDLFADSQSGTITASRADSDVMLKSNRGNVALRLAPTFLGELEAHTVNGTFNCDGILSQSDHPEDVPGFTGLVRGPLATGQRAVRRIQIDTVRGDIRVLTGSDSPMGWTL